MYNIYLYNTSTYHCVDIYYLEFKLIYFYFIKTCQQFYSLQKMQISDVQDRWQTKHVPL